MRNGSEIFNCLGNFFEGAFVARAPDGSGADSSDAIRTRAFDDLTPEKHEARVSWREATIRDGTSID